MVGTGTPAASVIGRCSPPPSITPWSRRCPLGFAPHGSFERIKRLFCGGESWHTSAGGSPDGLFILLGNGVNPEPRAQLAPPPDVRPTLSYLFGLPVAQYMEGAWWWGR